DRIFLYYTPRAGHRLPVPGPGLYSPGSPTAIVSATKLLPEINPALRSDFRRDIATGSENVSLWQIPGDWPLRSGFLKAVAPAAPTEQPLQVTLPRGGRETVVLAVNTGTPSVDLTASLNGVEASVQRLCPIPVYDGPEAGGMWRD